jgi:hypothetical protein
MLFYHHFSHTTSYVVLPSFFSYDLVCCFTIIFNIHPCLLSFFNLTSIPLFLLSLQDTSHPLLSFFAAPDNLASVQNSLRAFHYNTASKSSNFAKLKAVLDALTAVIDRFTDLRSSDYVVEALSTLQFQYGLIETADGWLLDAPAAAASPHHTPRSTPISLAPSVASPLPLVSSDPATVKEVHLKARLSELERKIALYEQFLAKSTIEVNSIHRRLGLQKEDKN